MSSFPRSVSRSMSPMASRSQRSSSARSDGNPARLQALRTHAKEQRAASIASSRAGSVAPSSRASSVAPSSSAGSPPPPDTRPIRKCKNSYCTGTKVGPEGVCINCGTVVQEDANIVSEIQFGETAGGAAYVTGVNVAFGEAGPRMNITSGNRQIAGSGGGKSNYATVQMAISIISSICYKIGRGVIPQAVQDSANYQFEQVQRTGWVRGRAVDRVAACCLYYAIRHSDFTGAMLIDIADAISADVFILGRWFKQLLEKIHGVDDGTGNIQIKHLPFEPLYPEDVIRQIASRLGFKDKTAKVQQDAVRILQRMDRDWIVSGRKPAGICGTALIIAARMNDLRRTVLEICYAAKVGKGTVEMRLEEFKQVASASLTVTDFRTKPFEKKAHDPPAYYRATKEFQDQQKKKPGRKRKLPTVSGGDVQAESNANKKQQNDNNRATTSPAPPLRTDADGFAIPARPNATPPASASQNRRARESTVEEDIAEAIPLDEGDEELALASKYGDFPINAKEIRKNRMQGSSLRDPDCDEEDKLTPEEEEAMNAMLEQINNPESEVYSAAAKAAGMQKDALLAALESSRPIKYREEGDVLNEVLDDSEFADDPEVRDCLLGDEERKLKEKLWLNENKQWLRDQQEKAHKARTAPPKKNRRKNTRKPRIGEGQLTPAGSAGEAAEQAAKRLKFSKKLDYSRLGNMFSSGPRGGPGGPGSVVTSAQTSRAGSQAEDSDDDVAEQEMEMEQENEDEIVDYDEQPNDDDDDDDEGEFGGGYEDDY